MPDSADPTACIPMVYVSTLFSFFFGVDNTSANEDWIRRSKIPFPRTAAHAHYVTHPEITLSIAELLKVVNEVLMA
jgi:hypothetical protein